MVIIIVGTLVVSQDVSLILCYIGYTHLPCVLFFICHNYASIIIIIILIIVIGIVGFKTIDNAYIC